MLHVLPLAFHGDGQGQAVCQSSRSLLVPVLGSQGWEGLGKCGLGAQRLAQRLRENTAQSQVDPGTQMRPINLGLSFESSRDPTTPMQADKDS